MGTYFIYTYIYTVHKNNGFSIGFPSAMWFSLEASPNHRNRQVKLLVALICRDPYSRVPRSPWNLGQWESDLNQDSLSTARSKWSNARYGFMMFHLSPVEPSRQESNHRDLKMDQIYQVYCMNAVSAHESLARISRKLAVCQMHKSKVLLPKRHAHGSKLRRKSAKSCGKGGGTMPCSGDVYPLVIQHGQREIPIKKRTLQWEHHL